MRSHKPTFSKFNTSPYQTRTGRCALPPTQSGPTTPARSQLLLSPWLHCPAAPTAQQASQPFLISRVLACKPRLACAIMGWSTSKACCRLRAWNGCSRSNVSNAQAQLQNLPTDQVPKLSPEGCWLTGCLALQSRSSRLHTLVEAVAWKSRGSATAPWLSSPSMASSSQQASSPSTGAASAGTSSTSRGWMTVVTNVTSSSLAD